MKHLFCLASLGVCMAFAGCAEPTTDDVSSSSGTEGAAFEYIADADFESTISSNPVMVVNFTADW